MYSKIVVRRSDGVIINRVTIEEGSKWSPPTDCDIFDDNNYNINGTYINGVYTPPPPKVVTADRLRIKEILEDADNIDFINRLNSLTVNEINSWINNQVTLKGNTVPLLADEVQTILRKFFKQIVKILIINK